MCDFYPDESATVWRQSQHRANKEHRCDCCFRTVRVGQQYQYTFSVFEGEAHSERACLPCARAIAAFGKEHSFYPDANSFAEYLNDCIEDGDEDSGRWRPMRLALNRRIAEGRAERAVTQ